MANYLDLVNGVPTVKPAAVVGGAANANKLAQLDANGRFTQDMMPAGIGADTAGVIASENIGAGEFVNIYNDNGVAKARKADAATGKEAHGYVLVAAVAATQAIVYSDDLNDQVAAMTPGPVYLSATAPGKASSAIPAAAGQLVQRLGVAVSATTIKTKIDQHYALS